MSELLSTEERLCVYRLCIEAYPDPDPVREFGEFVPDPLDTYGQMEIALSVAELQAMTDFLSVHPVPTGNGLGFVVI